MLASGAALLGQLGLYAPREGLNFDISDAGIDRAVALYNEFTGGAFDVQDRALALSQGQSEALKFPFAWAVSYMRLSSAAQVLDLSDAKARTALWWLKMFSDAVGSWQHHPRFATVARDMGTPNSFIHTVGQLLTAKWLLKRERPFACSWRPSMASPIPISVHAGRLAAAYSSK